MNEEVHYHCFYTYNRKNKVKTAYYQSSNSSHNTDDPMQIIKVLREEIKEVLGRTVIDFLMVGKMPVNAYQNN